MSVRTFIGVGTLAAVAASCSAARGADNVAQDEHEPIACTLTPSELSSRRSQLLPGLIARAEEVTDVENGLRLRFRSVPGLLAELAGAIDQERTCCSFLRFQVAAEPGTGPITLEVTGPPGTREMLRVL
jgi:hypothetical protein